MADAGSRLGAVAALRRHIERRNGMNVKHWIAEFIEGGVVPYAWTVWSKMAAYDIDGVIDWTTESTS